MRIVFMGTPPAAVASLERILLDGHEVAAVWTQPDRPAGRGNKLSAPPVKDYALEKNLPVFQPTKIKTPDSINLFESHRADAAVVVAYGRILPESYLNAFPMGAINVHFSLLPKYRGAAPVNWAIVNGETETGITTMRMDAGLDTGAILLQQKTAIGSDETAIELMSRLAALGADLVGETLARYENLTPLPQNDAQATYAPIMKKEDGRIEWSLTAAEINNRVRGFQPFPTSYTEFQGKKLTLWKTEVANAGFTFTDPAAGEIMPAKNGELIAACGEATALKILELQMEGKRRMSARDFLNGVRIETGEKFG